MGKSWPERSKVKSWFSYPFYWPGTSRAAILSFDFLSPVEVLIAQLDFSLRVQCLEFNKWELL